MRNTLLLVPVALVALSACEAGKATNDTQAESPQLTTITCADAQGLAARAGSAKEQWTKAGRSDTAKIIANNRATYFAALLNVAELKCKTSDLQADGALTLAFDAVRVAQGTASDYEKAQKWGEAAYWSTQAAGHLIKRLAAAR